MKKCMYLLLVIKLFETTLGFIPNKSLFNIKNSFKSSTKINSNLNAEDINIIQKYKLFFDN